MFEDLRKDGEDSPFFQQQDDYDPLLDAPSKKKRGSSGGGGGSSGFSLNGKIFGLTPFQRFALSLMLFILVFIGGFALLMANGSIVVF